MFKQFFLRAGLLLALLFSLSEVFAQNVAFKDFKPLRAEGKIPTYFLKSAAENYETNLEENISEEDKRRDKKTKEEFTLETTFLHQEMLLSGRILFGDPLTDYVNKVAAKILENEPALAAKLQFYTYKSSSTNAFCTPEGIIGINVGYLAQIENEAHLAATLCHEIAHYTEKHSLNHHLENLKLKKNKGQYRGMSIDQKIFAAFSRSREFETEADELGFLRYLKSGYDPQNFIDHFNVLHYAYLPFDEVPFDTTFFNKGSLVIPGSFFKKEFTPISSEMNYEDDMHTHPNIHTRKEDLKKLLNKHKNEGGNQDFLFPKEEFFKIREIARFESVYLDLINANYGDAIYSAYLLLQKHPDNKFLEESIAKALYGLTKYKNINEFHWVARSYTKVEGESQQLHYLLKQLNAKQLNTVALKYLRYVRQKHKDNNFFVKMEKELVEGLVVDNGLNLQDYWKTIPEDYNAPITVTNPNPRIREREIIKAKMKRDGEFFRMAFIEDLEDPHFTKAFKDAYQKRAKKEQEEGLSYKERMAKEKAMQKAFKAGIGNIHAKSIVVVDPDYFVSKKFLESEDSKKQFDQIVEQQANQVGIESRTISTKGLSANTLDDFNDYILLEEWLAERHMHGELEILPLSSDLLGNASRNFGSNLICDVALRTNKRGNSIYYFVLFDLKTGEWLYEHTLNYDGPMRLKKLEKLISEDLTIVSN